MMALPPFEMSSLHPISPINWPYTRDTIYDITKGNMIQFHTFLTAFSTRYPHLKQLYETVCKYLDEKS